jgi:hypothetical protein
LYNKFLQYFLSCFQCSMLLPCFRGFKTCLFNYFFIF